MKTEAPHIPVMLPQVLEALDPRDGEVYVDGTFGAGGYTRAILDAAACTVYAIDRDSTARVRAQGLAKEYGGRFTFLKGYFGDVCDLLAQEGVSRVNGFVLDLGVSSMQLDEAERGFSFRYDGPLDMRMDKDGDGYSAADIVNTYEESALADLIYAYGEERHSRRIAKAITVRRREKLFERTADLADVVRGVVPKKPGDKIDPATRTFQALRIAVNDELGELDRALDASVEILEAGGRLVVVSFHSLEDRRVKTFLKKCSAEAQGAGGSRHMPVSGESGGPDLFDLPLRNRAVKPDVRESDVNARARSARLRYGVRTSAFRKGEVS